MTHDDEGKPPLLGSWAAVYRAILVYLAVVIFLFWLFARSVAP